MRTRMIISMALLLLMAGIFTSGASSAAQETEGKGTSGDVSKEVKEALAAIETYTAEQRDKALDKVRIAIDNLDSRIDEMEKRMGEKWDQMDRTTREKAQSTLKTLRQKRNKLAEWYGGMKHSSSKAWEHVKKGFLDSYEALLDAYKKAADEFQHN